LAELCARSPQIAASILRVVEKLNGNRPDPNSFEQLHELIKAQTSRLANWRVAADDINYRRFFDTNDLAGICVENEAVFEATHRLILRLMAEGKVDGLRIDTPTVCMIRPLTLNVSSAASRLPQTVSETLTLCSHRKNPDRSGATARRMAGVRTTGYDFSNLVNGLFVDPAAVDESNGLSKLCR